MFNHAHRHLPANGPVRGSPALLVIDDAEAMPAEHLDVPRRLTTYSLAGHRRHRWRDGLNDLAIGLITETADSIRYCVGVFSGGVPSGDLSAMPTVEVCAATEEWAVVDQWQDDVDGDQVRSATPHNRTPTSIRPTEISVNHRLTPFPAVRLVPVSTPDPWHEAGAATSYRDPNRGVGHRGG